MKPYLLVAGDFVKTGGMDAANHALASHLADTGNQVHLVATRVTQDLASRNNVTVHYVPKPANSYLLAEPLLDRAGRRWARRIAGAGGRVVANGGNCQWDDVNWLHYVHAAYRPQTERRVSGRLKGWLSHRLFKAGERTALRRARIVIANSNRTRQDAIDRLGLPAARIHRVYYGVDADTFRPVTVEQRAAVRATLAWPENRPCVAFVGALGDHRKGFGTLFTAWQMLCADLQWDAELAVIGTGTELPYWKMRGAEAGLDSRIRFLGFRDDVPFVLAACDALVAPAHYEAYGRAAQEALCRGLPAFVTRSAGVADHYPVELHDLLIPEACLPAELAARLRAWRESIDGYRDAVAPLSRTLRAHTWNRMAEQIVELIESAA